MTQPFRNRSLLAFLASRTGSLTVPILALVAVMSTPNQAAALLDGDTVRIFGTFDLGVGGTMTQDGTDLDLDLSPTFGGSLGFDVGLGDFFALGLMGSSLSLKLADDVAADLAANVQDDVMMDVMGGGMIDVDAQGSAMAAVADGRSTILDFAIYPRLRIPLPVMEPYLMVPVGYATFTPPEGDSSSGMSLGIFAGVGFGLLPLLSIIVEGGVAMYFLDDVDIQENRINAGLALGF